MEEQLRSTIVGLRPSDPIYHERLTILPLVAAGTPEPRYVLLQEALQRGRLTITEVDEDGQVPFLRAVNKGPWPVLIFDGEELVGAKQNRIANATILLGVGERIVPVSCVEAGRWSHRSRGFSAGTYAAHPAMRRLKERQVRRRLTEEQVLIESGTIPRRSESSSRPERLRQRMQAERAGSFIADQAQVWNEVSRRNQALSVESPTSALTDAFAARDGDLHAGLRRLAPHGRPPVRGMTAAAVFLDGRFLCLDALWPAPCFAGVYPKLLRGYLLEALAPVKRVRKGQPADPEAACLRLLGWLADAPAKEVPGVDLGKDLRLAGDTFIASGLRWDDELVQVSVFPA